MSTSDNISHYELDRARIVNKIKEKQYQSFNKLPRLAVFVILCDTLDMHAIIIMLNYKWLVIFSSCYTFY